MTTPTNSNSRCRGVAYVLALLLLAIFGTLAVAFASTTDLTLQKSENNRQAVEARLAAESGLAFYTYTLRQIRPAPGLDSPDLLADIADKVAESLYGGSDPDGGTATQCYLQHDTIIIPEFSLGDEKRSCSATISIDGADGDRILLSVTGRYGNVRRMVGMSFKVLQGEYGTFDYGIVTKGSVNLAGQAQIAALDDSSKVDVFSCYCGDDKPAFSLSGQVSISGDIFTPDPNAEIRLDPNTFIAGNKGIDAYDSPHVHLGADEVELPEPDVSVFEPFAVNIMYDHTPPKGTYVNIRIPRGTNPTFSADTTLIGVVFVESPNEVTFAGKVTIQGVIVTEDARGSDEINTLAFSGQVVSSGVDTLPDEPQFAELRDLTGVFMLAPGFDATFGGQFGVVEGGMMADSITLSGQSGGVVNGPLICYEGDLDMGGLANLTIDQSGSRELPPFFTRLPSLKPLQETYVED